MTGYSAKKAQYLQEYSASLAAGTYAPLLLPQAVVGYFILFAYLLVPRNLSTVQPTYRFTLFSVIASISIWNIYNTRALEGTSGNLNGVLSAWCILWSATFVLWTDPQHDFRRLERIPNDRHGPLEPELRERPQYYWRGRPVSFFGRLVWTVDLLTNLRGRNWKWRFIESSRQNAASNLQNYRHERGPTLRTTVVQILL